MAEWGATESAAWADSNEDATTIADDLADSPLDDGPKDSLEKKVFRIRKNEIEELQTDRLDHTEKFVSIFKRTGKNRPLEIYRERFPRKALAVFSEVWKKQLDRSGNAGHLIIDDTGGNMLPYDLILDWINLCIDEGNDIKFPEIEEGANQLHILFDVIAVADYIKIPGKSLQEPLKKSAIKYARKNLIDIEYVIRLYDTADPDYDGSERLLQEAAAASIFEAWWTRRLDGPEFDEYCSHVEQLRVDFEQFDKDLNARFDEKKDFLDKKREERRANAKAATVADVPDVTAAGNGADSADGGWGTAATKAVATEDEWGAAGTNTGEDTTSSAWGAGGDNGGW